MLLGKKPKEKPPFQGTPTNQEAPFPGEAGAPGEIHEEIKENVGYPEESQAYPAAPKYQEPPAGEPMREPLEGGAEFSQEEAPGAVEPPETAEQFPFQEAQAGYPAEAAPAAEAYEEQYAPAPAQGAPNYEHMQGVAQGAAEGVRNELDAKIEALKDEVEELKKLDDQITEVVDALREMEHKYAELAEKAASLSPEELGDLKTKVDNIHTLLSQGLPALITEIRSLKPRAPAKKA
jgi:hypothetical protein